MGARSSYQPSYVSQGAGFTNPGHFASSRGPNAGPAGETTASGGTITDEGGYRYHKFTSPGTFVVTSNAGRVDVMMVGGGAGGGYDKGGGGGGGAIVCNLTPIGDGPESEGFAISSPGTFPVTIGDGGSGSTAGGSRGGTGGTTTFAAPWLPVTNAGGGGGGGSDNPPMAPGADGPTYGGSGGGGKTSNPGGAAGTYPTLPDPGKMSSFQSGGMYESPSYPNQGGGGGGAGGSGPIHSGGTKYGRAGKKIPWIPVNFGFANNPGDPTAGYFAGGGPGGGGNSPVATTGSIAGSGHGGYTSGNPNNPGNAASAAQANSGSGGGGGDAGAGPRNGGAGGSGILIIRYVKG